MFLRLVADSFTRRPRQKLVTAAALALGMAVATAAISVSLDVGDRLAEEFRSLGANLLVTPAADTLPLEIAGVDYRPVNSGAYLPESGLPGLKRIYWRNNIVAFAPVLDLQVEARKSARAEGRPEAGEAHATLIGTWANHALGLADGGTFPTGAQKASPWWAVVGNWFADDRRECLVGADLAASQGIQVNDWVYLRVPGGLPSADVALRVTGLLTTGGPENNAIVAPLAVAQGLAGRPGLYRKLYVSALTKPADAFARRDPRTMNAEEFERWSCSPYVASIAYSIKQALAGSDVRVIRRVADGEGQMLTHVRALLWFVTAAALLAAALAVGAGSAASVIERRGELAIMKALGAGSGTVGLLLVAEQLLLAVAGGAIGYSLGLVLARMVGTRVFGVPPEPSLLVLGVILVLAALVTVVGSAIPFRRASRFEPAVILRGE